MAQYDFVMNEHVPHGGNKFTKWLGTTILKLMGWKITGAFHPKWSLLVFLTRQIGI